MSIVTSVSTDSTNLSVSMLWLKINRVNWSIFATHFEIAVAAKDKWDHFTDTTLHLSYNIYPITKDQAVKIHQ
ncbi:uncharacterized protein BT62DRAFT_890875 [Guyanagaster necrorhizus]|uniref:Uncharacterized protein n=1 Tax=Guyanagaster necrorhizus TaxID=856835 RepID=A0A9P8AU42_9AGAR|nr:uncharacterized protein BT62DRAFT_890875 [Guyanagaster necrorhizus MCA 3950]KAG7447890.1 hypothetical protein BT62DRAFT_890875 [Guyanagaster necrorhizus MCA 3950]